MSGPAWIGIGQGKVLRLFLVDDHRIFLEGLVRLFQDHPGLEVVGTATDGRSALEQIPACQPDVVLLDISMHGLNGLEALRLLRKASSKTKVLILSVHDNEVFVQRALEAGAAGYPLKEASAEELFLAITEVARGNAYLYPAISSKLIAQYLGPRRRRRGSGGEPALTGREREVLQLLAEGQSTRAIANLLHVSPQTIQTHRKRIMRKLNLHHLSDLIRYAIRHKLIKA